jgi:hypothetical protein
MFDFDWKKVRSTFLGNVLAHTFLLALTAAAGFFGFAPEETIRAMMPTSFGEASLLAGRVVFLFLGCASLAVLIQQMREMHWPSLYVPMEWAARRAYEEARAANKVIAGIAERVSHGQEDGILGYFATYIGSQIETFGLRPPSTKYEQFLIGSGSFRERANDYWESHSRTASYRSVRVKRSDLKPILIHLRKGRDEFSQ